MSQALYTSMGGISAAQSQINVVSNNIANLNTVAFKESSVTFQDIFSTTLTAGNAPTVTTGGKNPVQVGLGVQVGTIARNFNAGTWTSTGRTTDMMIQGNGFFTVQSADGEMFLTRAGNFSFDANGDLVNAQGYKVAGAGQLFSTTTSGEAVHIPQKIVSSVTPNADFSSKPLSDLNAVQVTVGDFSMDITTSSLTVPVSVNLSASDDTMTKVAAKIQAAIDANPSLAGNVTVICDATTGATIKFQVDGAVAQSIKFNPGTSNFVMATQLGSATLDPATNTYTSKILDYKADVSAVTAFDNAISISNYTIAEDGSIEATYSNGDKLTIESNPADQTFQFKYTTSTGTLIRGNDILVDPNVAVPSNFQMQLANVVNAEGLVAAGGNLFMAGPNSGDVIFTVGSAIGLGSIKSGGLEASNVDMSKQFSDMILAQRAVQANSRVFSTTSDIMQTLVQLGR